MATATCIFFCFLSENKYKSEDWDCEPLANLADEKTYPLLLKVRKFDELHLGKNSPEYVEGQ